ncbi:hypothetical protein AI2642V1_3062 [Citrobacter freundii]|nr:hypothetical protein AI2642V1_3062 [Citrobacter freundii]CAH3579519.1 hypothetical protein AI2642V1_3062 [Citrobacter freundii]
MLVLWVVMIFIIVQFIAMKIKIISIFVNYCQRAGIRKT